MQLSTLLVAALAFSGANGQVIETLEDYATMGKRFAEYARGAAPNDAETLRNVLAAGAGGASGNGCPGAGCGANFVQRPAGSIAEVRVEGASSDEEATKIRNAVKVNVAKTQDIPKELLAFVEEYEQERNEQERTMLESALHSVPKAQRASFLASDLPFDVKIAAGSKQFPEFYEAIRSMEARRAASEEKVRDELMSLIAKSTKSSFLGRGSAAALAEAIANLQRKALEDPAFGQQAMDAINAAGQHASFVRKNPEFNIKYEFAVAHGSTKHNDELSAVLTSLKKGEHSQFLRNAQFDRKTQAPMVWLHLNEPGHASFAQMPQAITDSVDLFIEQGPASSQ